MHTWLQQIIFYGFAFLAIISSIAIISQNNPVRCVLTLVFTFFCSSIIWLLAQSEFLALILILVYVGAVMTLFLFVVMMLDIKVASLKAYFVRVPIGLLFVALLVGLMLASVPKDTFNTQIVEQSINVAKQSSAVLSDTSALGMVLYTKYVWAFELAAILLLVAIVAAITLTHRVVPNSKKQSIRKQLLTRPEESVTMHSMKSE